MSTVERRMTACPECTLSPEAERDLLANTDPADACPDCCRPADYGCHDLCPALPGDVVLTLPDDEPPF